MNQRRSTVRQATFSHLNFSNYRSLETTKTLHNSGNIEHYISIYIVHSMWPNTGQRINRTSRNQHKLCSVLVKGYCGSVMNRKELMNVSLDDTGLSHPQVTDNQNFEEELLLLSYRTLQETRHEINTRDFTRDNLWKSHREDHKNFQKFTIFGRFAAPRKFRQALQASHVTLCWHVLSVFIGHSLFLVTIWLSGEAVFPPLSPLLPEFFSPFPTPPPPPHPPQ